MPTLSEAEKAEYKEEVEHYDRQHPSERGHSTPYQSKSHAQTNQVSKYEREEYAEEVEYHEKTHPRGKTPKKKVPMTREESFGMESGFVTHGEEQKTKKMPTGMFGYDLELDHHEKTRPYRESTSDKLGRYGRIIGGVRDDLYGYRDYNPLNYSPVEVGSLEFGAQQKRIRSKKLNRSHVGEINFFPARQSSLITMDPFHIGGSAPARGMKGSKRTTRSSDPFYIPDSMAWMF